VWAAPELLGAPTRGRGSAWPGGGGGESHRSQISLSNCPKYTKTAKSRRLTHFLAYKLPKTKYNHETFFEESILIIFTT
jgi:hypothetical protein